MTEPERHGLRPDLPAPPPPPAPPPVRRRWLRRLPIDADLSINLLASELKKRSISINNKADRIINGQYIVIDDDNDNALVVRLVLSVSDKEGARLVEFFEDFCCGGFDRFSPSFRGKSPPGW